VADTLDVQETSINFSTNFLQEGQIGETQADTKIFWIIDDIPNTVTNCGFWRVKKRNLCPLAV
jgi:hypothetical protein